MRNSLKYVSYKDLEEVSKDLKESYQASTEEMALLALDRFEEKWGKKYPHIVNSWRNNWESLSTYFKYSPEIRKPNRSRVVFPNDEALFKGVYLAVMEATKKLAPKPSRISCLF
ncbi:transposase [bacterium]|nr:transposase [bacterium]